MTADKVREMYSAQPFQPFTLELPSGEKVLVRHPELMAISPTGRVVVVFGPGDRMKIVDLLLVEAVTVGNGKPTRRRRGA